MASKLYFILMWFQYLSSLCLKVFKVGADTIDSDRLFQGLTILWPKEHLVMSSFECLLKSFFM